MIALPTSPTGAFPLGERTDDPVLMYLADVFTVGANLAGVPGDHACRAASPTRELPVGLQLTARKMDEATLLRVAAAYQHATDWHERPPASAGLRALQDGGFRLKARTSGLFLLSRLESHADLSRCQARSSRPRRRSAADEPRAQISRNRAGSTGSAGMQHRRQRDRDGSDRPKTMARMGRASSTMMPPTAA